MEVSGVIFRQAQGVSGDLFNTHSSRLLLSGRSIHAGKRVPGELRFVGSQDFKCLGVSSSGFSDNGHLQYYVSPRCGAKKEMMAKEKKTTNKKKSKLIKGLMKNLSAYSEMGFSKIEDGDDSISSTTELLLAQLEKLKAEEKEMKRKQKEEKAKLKASRMESSSSSSSESSDSDCGEVINMKSLRTSTVLEPKLDDLSQEISKEETSSIGSSQKLEVVESSLRAEQQCFNFGTSTSVAVGASAADRIDVCIGGKCKKLGAEALMEEFKAMIGIEGAVVGCKCMGKCRSAPNVRVSNLVEGGESCIIAPSNPLYIGVGLEDVSTIVANFLGEEKNKDLGYMVATA